MSQETQSDELILGFVEESTTLLRGVPGWLAEAESNPDAPDAINAAFRAIHTIKGNAGFFNYGAVKHFAHKVENILDEIRNGNAVMTSDLCRMLVEAVDLLDEMLAEEIGTATARQLGENESAILQSLLDLLRAATINGDSESVLLKEVKSIAAEMVESGMEQAIDWSRRLIKLTEESSQPAEAADDNNSPGDSANQRYIFNTTDLTEMVIAAKSHCAAILAGDTERENELLSSLGELADAVGTAGDAPLAAMLVEAVADLNTIVESPLDLDALLLGSVWEKFEGELESRRREVAKEEVAEEVVAQPEATSAPVQKAAGDAPAAKAHFLRVKEASVDEFLDDVSNLFITCERLKDLHSRMVGSLSATDLVDELRHINVALTGQTNDLQKSVAALRRVPTRELFSKFPRVARSLAKKLGKQLQVHTSGDDIEIDKSLVADLDAPLMHMVRNVCDHGLQTPEERQAAGLPAEGNMWLSCELTRSHVVVRIEDDGRGIDPDRLRRKAVEKGIFTAEQAAALSNQEAVELIFHAGLSTAEKITDVSGRGVGMDVVRSQLEGHKGRIHVTSELGKGTQFRIEIPIRSAVVVVDGLVIRQGGALYALPFEFVKEICDISNSKQHKVQGKPVIFVRGDSHPTVSLAELAGDEPADRTDHGVLVSVPGGSVCLAVEAVIGQRKIVISSLSDVLSGVALINGVAQLGGGQLALVLNPNEFLTQFEASAVPELAAQA